MLAGLPLAPLLGLLVASKDLLFYGVDLVMVIAFTDVIVVVLLLHLILRRLNRLSVRTCHQVAMMPQPPPQLATAVEL